MAVSIILLCIRLLCGVFEIGNEITKKDKIFVVFSSKYV